MTNAPKSFPKSLRKTILSGLFVALDIVTTRFFSFMVFMTRISFQFLANALCGFFLGPFYAMLAGIAGDILGMLINSAGQPYFPGFTVTAALKGLYFGFMLHKKEPTYGRILVTMAISGVIFDMLLNPLWLSMLYGYGYIGLFLMRLPVHLVMIPLSATLLYFVIKPLKNLSQNLMK